MALVDGTQCRDKVALVWQPLPTELRARWGGPHDTMCLVCGAATAKEQALVLMWAQQQHDALQAKPLPTEFRHNMMLSCHFAPFLFSFLFHTLIVCDSTASGRLPRKGTACWNTLQLP